MRKKIIETARQDTPDLKANLKESALYQSHMYHAKQRQKQRAIVSPLRLASGAAFALILLTLFIINPFQSGKYSDFYLEINPSIKAQINDEDTLMNVEALNDDGAVLLASLGQVEHMPIDAFIDLVIEKAIELEFIDENEEHLVLFDVISEDEALKEHHAKRIDNLFKEIHQTHGQIHHLRGLGGPPTEAERELIDTYQLSPMHLRLIGTLLTQDDTWTFAYLSDLSMRELMDKLDEEQSYGGPNHPGPRHPFDDDDHPRDDRMPSRP